MDKRERNRQASIDYHLLFGHRLSKKELEKWEASGKVKKSNLLRSRNLRISKPRGSFDKGVSQEKLKIARRAAKILEKIPTIKMVAVTGSLAMMNAKLESDIDLMIITRKDSLWLTRLAAFIWLTAAGLGLRRAGDKNEKDKLCLNLWLDERDLVWQKRNAFTAHEIAQIMPLVNKEKTYERFLWENKWILDYWPKSVKVNSPLRDQDQNSKLLSFLNLIAYKLQYRYMKPKMTREVVSLTRAEFHPVDWSARLKY